MANGRNSGSGGEALERQIQAELQQRRLNNVVNKKRLGSDFLNDLKLPKVDNNPNTIEMSVNLRGQNVIDRQRMNIVNIEHRDKLEQKRLLSRHKNRGSDGDSLSRGTDNYRSNAYLGRDNLGKNERTSSRHHLDSVETGGKHL